MQSISVKSILQLLIIFIFTASTTCSILAWFASQNYYFELLSHFRLQYLIAQLCSAGLLCFFFRRFFAYCAMVLLVLNFPVFPYLFTFSSVDLKNAHSFRVMTLNVLQSNTYYAQVVKLIRKEKPEIIVLEEVDARWVQALDFLKAEYPYGQQVPRADFLGIALYSKLPLTDIQIHKFSASLEIPFILATAQWQGHLFRILALHPLTPLGGFELRNAQFSIGSGGESASSLGRRKSDGVRGLEYVAVVALFSAFFEGIRDSQLGFGAQPSWPVNGPFVRIPVDHVLLSPQFIVLKRWLGPNVGSDHLPVFAELAFR